VSDRDFLFALDLSGGPESDEMLTDVARTVLGHVGYTSSSIDALTGELRTALAERAVDGKRRCEVRFRSAAGQLEIVVAGEGGAEWRTTRSLPPS
jgi:hypothetical protein